MSFNSFEDETSKLSLQLLKSLSLAFNSFEDETLTVWVGVGGVSVTTFNSFEDETDLNDPTFSTFQT